MEVRFALEAAKEIAAEDFPKILREPGVFPNQLLPEVINACMGRLSMVGGRRSRRAGAGFASSFPPCPITRETDIPDSR